MPAHPPAAPKQPGLMGQMAATAGGVAVGHVVGSAITGAMSGSGGQPAPQAPAAQQSYAAQPSQFQQNPCQYHIDELIRCTQTQNDITMCTGFSDALKECSRTYGLMP